MRRGLAAASLAVLTALLAGCAATPAATTAAAGQAAAQPTTLSLGDDLRLERLEEGLWLHVSESLFDGRPTPANGLVLLTGGGALLVDTPWTEEQTDRLLEAVASRLGRPVTHLVVTHFHADCMGGIAAAERRGVATFGSAATVERARREGLPVPSRGFEESLRLDLGDESVEAYHPGPGHSPDNVVVYLPARRLLFGGCLVKSAASRGRGYVGDADLAAWPATLERVAERFPEAERIVPGHGPPGDRDLLAHTRRLVVGEGGSP